MLWLKYSIVHGRVLHWQLFGVHESVPWHDNNGAFFPDRSTVEVWWRVGGPFDPLDCLRWLKMLHNFVFHVSFSCAMFWVLIIVFLVFLCFWVSYFLQNGLWCFMFLFWISMMYSFAPLFLRVEPYLIIKKKITKWTIFKCHMATPNYK